MHWFNNGNPYFSAEVGYEEGVSLGCSIYWGIKNGPHVYQLSPIARFFKEEFTHSLELQFSIFFNQN